MTVTRGTAVLPSACRQTTRASDSPRARAARNIVRRQLLDHETASHARDIGHREIAEYRGRQHHVRERVASDPPFSGEHRVHDQEARRRRREAFVDHVEAARSRRPAEGGVEDEQRDHAEPEGGRGIAEQRDHAQCGHRASARGAQRRRRRPEPRTRGRSPLPRWRVRRWRERSGRCPPAPGAR